MTDQERTELLMEEQANKAAQDKALGMIRAARLARERGEPMPKPEPKKLLTLEEAKAKGDVVAMIAAKMGRHERMALEEEKERLLANIDITSVVRELGTLEKDISKAKADYENWRVQEAKRLDAEYLENQRKMRQEGFQNMAFVQLKATYQQAKENIDDSDAAKARYRKIDQMRQRRAMLEEARERFTVQNADLIAEMRRQKVKTEIERSGLLRD